MTKMLSVNLKILIQQNRLTASSLARETGIPQPIIHRLMTGQNDNPTLKTILPIAKYFDITLSQLVGDDSEISNIEVIKNTANQKTMLIKMSKYLNQCQLIQSALWHDIQ